MGYDRSGCRKISASLSGKHWGSSWPKRDRPHPPAALASGRFKPRRVKAKLSGIVSTAFSVVAFLALAAVLGAFTRDIYKAHGHLATALWVILITVYAVSGGEQHHPTRLSGCGERNEALSRELTRYEQTLSELAQSVERQSFVYVNSFSARRIVIAHAQRGVRSPSELTEAWPLAHKKLGRAAHKMKRRRMPANPNGWAGLSELNGSPLTQSIFAAVAKPTWRDCADS